MSAKPIGNKVESESKILSLVQAQSQTSEDLSERLVKIENLVEKQEGRNQNLLYAVLFALVFIVITVAVEVILSTRQDQDSVSAFYSEIRQMRDEQNKTNVDISQLLSQFELLKAKNSYLK